MQASVAESHFECLCGAVETDGRIRRHCANCGYHTVMPANFCVDCGAAFVLGRVVEVVEVGSVEHVEYVIATDVRERARRWSPEEDARLVELVSRKVTSRKIAETLGRSQSAISTRRSRQQVVA
jgi:uncharacterized OB-fold protein